METGTFAIAVLPIESQFTSWMLCLYLSCATTKKMKGIVALPTMILTGEMSPKEPVRLD
jgi:hypothetical protein